MAHENEIDLNQLVKALWLNKRKVLKWGFLGFIIGLVIAFSIPKTYRAEVKIAPEGSGEARSFGSMNSLASMAGIDLSSNFGKNGVSEKLYPEIIKSTPFLVEFAGIEIRVKEKKVRLYKYLTEEQKSPWWSGIFKFPFKIIGRFSSAPTNVDLDSDHIDIFNLNPKQAGYIGALSKLIFISTDKKSGIITIRVTMQNPVVAAVVADSVLSKLQTYMTSYRTSKARENLAMNQKMLDEAKQAYYQAEAAYAAAVDRNQNIITQSARVKLDRLINEKNLAFGVYQQLASQVEVCKIKLQEDTPIATIIEPASIPISASAPNKKMIIFVFTFLAMLAAAGVVIYRHLQPRKSSKN